MRSSRRGSTGSTPADRSLLQDAAVLGQTFSLEGLAAISGETAEDLAPRLDLLVRREILTVETDPRAPTRGQHAFVQALVREVAYGTLAKRERRERHLAAARYLESLGDDELAGVVASHFVAAYRSAPDGPAGEAVAAQARVSLLAAADRAEALGALGQAIDALTSALEVTRDAARSCPPARADRLAARSCARASTKARRASPRRSRRTEAIDDEIGVIRAIARRVLGYIAAAQIASADRGRRAGPRGRRGARRHGPTSSASRRIAEAGEAAALYLRGHRTDRVPEQRPADGDPLVRSGARPRRAAPSRRDRRDGARDQGDGHRMYAGHRREGLALLEGAILDARAHGQITGGAPRHQQSRLADVRHRSARLARADARGDGARPPPRPPDLRRLPRRERRSRRGAAR